MKNLLLALLLVSTSAFAEVREIKTMSDINSVIKKDTLVVFDIDNTILEPTQTMGSDQWGMNEIKRFKATGIPEKTAVDQGVRRFADVALLTQVQPVEKLTPRLIYQYQIRGIKVLALTARPLYLMTRSIAQLKSIGVDLARTAPASLNLQIAVADPIKYQDGVIAVGPHNNKGEVLRNLLTVNPSLKSGSIVFIDDKAHHVASMETFIGKGPLPFVGFRYGAADAKVAGFDANVGDMQYKFFSRRQVVISDEQASDALKLNR